MNNFDTILERIKEETGAKSMRQLAEIIGVKHQTISAAKKKDEFSANWAFVIAQKYRLSTDWIMTGEGPKRLNELTGDWSFYEELEQWAKETGQSENIRWMRNQIESFFPMFAEWKKRRAEGDDIRDETPASKVA